MSHGSVVLKGLVVATLAIIFMVGIERRRTSVHPVRRIAEAPVSRPQNLPPGVTTAKWNAIQHTLTQRSLEAVATPAGRTVLQSPRLRGEFDETALRLAPVRNDSTEPWSVRWGWCRREGESATPVQVSHRGNKVYVAAEGISETFENRRSGIEHSFRVNGPAADTLRVRVDVETSLIATTASADRIVFKDGAGNEV
ncbi:MAG TPA: hypothetical protein VJS20_09420, partial [Gemmatimonadales bacterium]|nr:hypothetical protein [Gemmatimonadales bacterium]